MKLRKRYITVLLTIVIALMAMVGCRSRKPAEPIVPIDKNISYYTQVGMWAEKNNVVGTNYSTGTFIPVNSPVTMVNVTNNVISFDYNGTPINLVNIQKYTKLDISELFDRTFAKTQVDLSKYSESELNDIMQGKVVAGMTKGAVLLSRGYPPSHATISLNSNKWKYWASRFDTIVYQFVNDKVANIID